MKKKTEKHPYDDTTADLVIVAYNLDPKVKKVWKTRGHIPGAYFVEGGVSDSPILPDRDPRARRIAEILSRPEVAPSKFRLGQKCVDVSRGKSSLNKEEALSISAELVDIRNKISKAQSLLTLTNIRAVFTDIRLHPTKVVDSRLYSKITDSGRKPLTERELDTVRLSLIVLKGILKHD